MDETSTIGNKPEHDISGRSIEDILAGVKYLDFYQAMSQDFYKPSGLTIEEYGEAMEAFKLRMDIHEGQLEKQISKLSISITLITNCLIYGPVLGLDEEDQAILIRLGVTCNGDLQETIESAQKVLNGLVSKSQLLNGELPKLVQVIKTTGQDMVAELSLGVELKLGMDITLLEYISFYRAAQKKNKAANASFKKNKK